MDKIQPQQFVDKPAPHLPRMRFFRRTLRAQHGCETADAFLRRTQTQYGVLDARRPVFAHGAPCEIYRALKPGGILSITKVLPDPDYQTPSAIRELAQEVGFVAHNRIGSFPAFTMNLSKPPVHRLEVAAS